MNIQAVIIILVVSIAGRLLLQLEQITQIGQTKVPFNIIFIIHDAGTERLFMGLALEDLLLDSARLPQT